MKKNSESKSKCKDWSNVRTCKKFDLGFPTGDSNPLQPELFRIPQINNGIFVESLIEQLCRLLEKDPRQQHRAYLAICGKLKELRLINDTYGLEELSTLRAHYGHALTSFLTNPEVRSPIVETSRYLTEFEELGFIASGGFGQVFRARHRLDQVEYAVKKVKVRYKNAALFLRNLTEVKTLARLNHPNIVQYKAAWLEACVIPSLNDVPQVAEHNLAALPSTEGSDIEFLHGSEDETTTTDTDSFVQPYRRSYAPNIELGAVLYLTMQLCDENLRQWLDRRNSCLDIEKVDFDQVLNIMLQITAGLEYIHSCSIVHHDIKPGNIFINSQHHVQVGDFGLACCLQQDNHSMNSCPLLAGQRGTQLYVAPEQLHGHCNPEADLFSLGLIFIELMALFRTDMERVKELTRARAGLFENFMKMPSGMRQLVAELLDKEPSKRGSARGVRKRLEGMRLAKGQEDTVEELRRLLEEKDKEIGRLKQICNDRNLDC